MGDKYQAAMQVIAEAIRNDAELRNGYKANIAMAFKDEYDRIDKAYKNKSDIHMAANKAADNFLKLWAK